MSRSSTDNIGNQTLTFDYKQEALSEGFNKILYKVVPKGILEGGELKNINNNVFIKPFSSFFEDDEVGVGIRLQTLEDVLIHADSVNDYVIGDFEWQNTADNFMSFKAVNYVNIEPNQFIFGKVLFEGNTVVGFDTSMKTWSRSHYENFKYTYPNFYVYNHPTLLDTIVVCEGEGFVNGNKITVSEKRNIGVNLSTTHSRKDLVVVNKLGSISLIQGEDSETPTIPQYPSDTLLIAILTITNEIIKIEYVYNSNASINGYMNHASEDDTYGLGTTEKYGHTKVIDNLNSEEYVEGESLSAYQGKILNDKITETSQSLESTQTDLENAQQSIENIISGGTTVGKADKDDVGNKISTYYEKKGNIIEFVSNLPTNDIENRIYGISHTYTTTETKETTSLDIIGSYTTTISSGKYSVDPIYNISMSGYNIGSFWVSGSRVFFYESRDCQTMIPLTEVLISDVKTWTIETTVDHSDFFAGDKNKQLLIKLANVDQVEQFFIRKEQKGSAGGVATLDENGKIPLEELSFSTLVYMGVSNDFTTDIRNIDIPQKGMFFISGTTQTYQDIEYKPSDWIIYNGEVWERSANSSAVSTVNGKFGEVVLTSEDIKMSSTDTKTIKTVLDSKQENLSSGVNIKTINNKSVLGSGNLDIEADLPIVQIDRVNFDAQKSAGTLSNTTLYVVYDLN